MGKQWKRWKIKSVADFILGGSKITADGDCSHEIKRRSLFGRKVMTNLDSIFKSRDITLSTKVYLFKAIVFPVVMYGYESWTIRKAEHRRIDAFGAQLCPTLSDPMDCRPPGFSIHGISQAKVLEWGAIAFPKISS